MKNRPIFFTIAFIAFLLITSCNSEASKKDKIIKTPDHPLLSLTLKWTMKDNSIGEKKVADSLTLSAGGKDSFYLLFRKNKRLEALFCFDNEAIPLDIDLDQASSLALSVVLEQKGGNLTMDRLLFASDRVMGTRVPRENNIYCLKVIKDLTPFNEMNIPDGVPEEFHNAALRTRAMNTLYASESDKYSEKIGKTFIVKTGYAMPRFILSSEEWMELPVVKKKSSGGPLSIGVDKIIFGDSEKKTANIPVYSLDVLQDDIEAEGEFPVAFQTARSIYNDTLESRVIYQLTEGKRRILSTSVVFGQMMKNRQLRGMENQIIMVDQNNLSAFNNCSDLWPSAKTKILSFLRSHPDGKVIVPRYPVAFFHGDDPLYGMYAWFQVEPQTGRMKGILPTGLHGATDEPGIFQTVLRNEVKRRIKGKFQKLVPKEGGIKAYFGGLAGMYVSSAGILEGVTITVANPRIASLSGGDWEKFLASHAIKYSRNFLTAYKDTYDSYSARAGFWGGVAAIVSHFNGKEAASACLENAWQDIEERILDDIRSWIANQLNSETGEATFDALEETARRNKAKEKKAAELFNTVNDQWGSGQSSFGEESKIESLVKDAKDGKNN